MKNIYGKMTSFSSMKKRLERKTVSRRIIQDLLCRPLEKEGKYVTGHPQPLPSFYERRRCL